MIKLSVIIPTLGRKDELYNTMLDLSKQDLDKEMWELLIVIQNRPDIDEFKSNVDKLGIRYKLIYSSAPNASLARNIGLIESRGKYVLFLDDDLVINNTQFLANHLNAYIDNDISGVFGQVLDPGVPERTTRHKWSYKKHIGWMFFPPNYNQECKIENGGAGNLSVIKDYAMAVGGMDINFEKGAHREESDFCLRLTSKYGMLLFEPKASVIHLGAAVGGCRNWGKNDGIHPAHHVFGEWYFILKGLKLGTVKWYQLHYHLGVLFFRQIWNESNRMNKRVIPKACWNSIKGFGSAVKSVWFKPAPKLLPEGYKYEIVVQHEL